jgi:hypothetical protein
MKEEELEKWIEENFNDVEDWGFDYGIEGEVIIWFKDLYFDDRDLAKLREILDITGWHVEAEEPTKREDPICKVLLEVEGYLR